MTAPLSASVARTLWGLALYATLGLAGCGQKTQSQPTLPDNPQSYPAATKKSGMTWYKDVLPVVQDSCQGCHQPGGIGPFSLITYDDGMKVASAMSSAVQSRRMPPWMPADNCQSFLHSRRLTQDQVDTVYSWADDGAPAGDPKDAPPMVPAGPTLEWVDRTLTPAGTYTPNQAIVDDYHCYLLDPKVTSDQDLIGYEFVPGVRAEVHHVLVYSVDPTEAQNKDNADPAIGWTCFGGPGTKNSQLVAAWVPGTFATTFPAGTGVPIKAGSALAVQVHYNTQNGPAQPDQSTLKLQFSKTPIPLNRKAVISPLANTSFAIPPGATGYTAIASNKVPSNLTVWGLAPHMHTKGRHARVEVDGQCLLDIPSWDFHWQQFYFFSSPTGVQVAKDATTKFTCVWDNPTDQKVTWGEQTSDEMCINYFYVTL